MNLWADLEHNSQQQPDPAGQGRTRSKRRLTEQLFLSTLRHWLLDEYVASYCRSLPRIFRRCYWIDALGLDAKASTIPTVAEAVPVPASTGKGRKKSNGQASPLAPALQTVAALSQRLTQEERPLTLYGLLLTMKNARSGRGARNGSTPQQLALPKEGGIIRAGWQEAASALLTEVEQSPAIFLLNPFSPTLFSYDDLLPLLQRAVPTELCLLIPHKQLEARLLSAQQDPALAAQLTNLLRSDRWKGLSLKEDERNQAIEKLLDLFITAMQRHFHLPLQRIMIPVQVRPARVEMMPYTLLFATRRQDSMLAMNDAVCLYHRRVYQESHRGVLNEEWFARQQQERLIEALEQLYQQALQQGRRMRRWPDLRLQLLLSNFGQFTVKDYDTIIHRLLLSGEVRCEWKRPPTNNTGEERIPGNDDLLRWRQ